jgi:hypothetical protein
VGLSHGGTPSLSVRRSGRAVTPRPCGSASRRPSIRTEGMRTVGLRGSHRRATLYAVYRAARKREFGKLTRKLVVSHSAGGVH